MSSRYSDPNNHAGGDEIVPVHDATPRNGSVVAPAAPAHVVVVDEATDGDSSTGGLEMSSSSALGVSGGGSNARVRIFSATQSPAVVPSAGGSAAPLTAAASAGGMDRFSLPGRHQMPSPGGRPAFQQHFVGGSTGHFPAHNGLERHSLSQRHSTASLATDVLDSSEVTPSVGPATDGDNMTPYDAGGPAVHHQVASPYHAGRPAQPRAATASTSSTAPPPHQPHTSSSSSSHQRRRSVSVADDTATTASHPGGGRGRVSGDLDDTALTGTPVDGSSHRPHHGSGAAIDEDADADDADADALGDGIDELNGILRQFDVFRRSFFDLHGRCRRAMERMQREQVAIRQRRHESAQRVRQMQEAGQRRVRLNVGGVLFEVSDEVLRRHPGSYFSVLLEGNFSVDLDAAGAIFIDRDPIVFRDILYYLRTGLVPAVPSRPCAACYGARARDDELALFGAAGGSPESRSSAAATAAAASLPSAQHAGAAAGGAHAPDSVAGVSMAAAGAGNATPVANDTAHRHQPPLTSSARHNNNNGGGGDFTAEYTLLEEEARFFGLSELRMLLTSDRGLWRKEGEHHVVEGAVPSARCFAPAALVDNDTIYVFGGCTADDKFFDAFYTLRVADATAAATASSANRRPSATASPDNTPSRAGLGMPGAPPLAAASSLGGGGTASPILGMQMPPPAQQPPTAASHPSQQSSPYADGPGSPTMSGGATAHREPSEVYMWQRVRARYGQAPSPRSGHTMSLLDGHLIVIGGNNAVAMESSCHAFNVMASGWAPIRNTGEPLLPRSGHTVTVVGGRLYLIGGKQIFPTMRTHTDLLIGTFDADQSTIDWVRAPVAGLDQRAYHSAVAYKDTIYVFGGIVNNVYCRDLSVYHTTREMWVNISVANVPGYAPPPPRSGHIAVVYGREMVVLGSYSEEGPAMSLLALDMDSFVWRVVETTGTPPLRRAAPTGVVIPADSFRGKPPRLLAVGGFDIAARRCFNELHVITL